MVSLINYSGGLSGGGDDIILRDNFFKEHDKVDYEGWQEWPNVRYNDYITQQYDAATATYYDVPYLLPMLKIRVFTKLTGQIFLL